jgi:mono/diheme cytochrome c family protein
MLPMPGFNQTLSNEQIVSLSNYIRLSWGNNQKITVEQVQNIRQLLLDSGDITPAK